MTFAEKLKELRQAAGLTQAELAERSGRGLGAIRDYEQGNREPLLSTAFKLAAALDVSVEVFADCDAGPPGEPKRGRPPKSPHTAPRPRKAGRVSPRGTRGIEE
jgi:transcriptional regulator with XRE-family HTH domain